MNEQDWRALAAQNGQRVTYPSWKPKEHWEAKSKADPWVPNATTMDWRKADWRKARFFSVIVGWMSKPLPALPPSGVKLEPRPESWSKPPSSHSRNW